MSVSGNLPPMDAPSIMYARLLDAVVVDTTGAGTLILVCSYCEDLICEVEPNDTMRVLLNTALQHECGET